MHDGFMKVAAATPKIRVADTAFNAREMIKMIREADRQGAKLIVLPELSITGYTCGDLFFQESLILQALDGIKQITVETAVTDILIVAGLPLAIGSKLYNAAAFIKSGNILGFATKSFLPDYNEFYETRYFSVLEENTFINIDGKQIPAGPKLLFCAENMDALKISAEICEDLWAPIPPSTNHALNGASVIVNLSASDEAAGKNNHRRLLLRSQSGRSICAYLYANAGPGESSTDLVFGGRSSICENGIMLAEAKSFEESILYADIDLQRIIQQRRKTTTFRPQTGEGYHKIMFNIQLCKTPLDRIFNPTPFIPQTDAHLEERCEEVLSIQYQGLKKRLAHIGLKTVTLGISGGLDSTLALLVTAKAFDSLNLSRSGIVAVTMPCFGTSDRTYSNAQKLIASLGAQFREVNIKAAVTQHLTDIGCNIENHDVTFENAQARERTQVLMDIANQTGGIVIGTGDLSELALGFATYNGDHMSMYGVNASVPKTLVRFLVKYVADTAGGELKDILYDILDTPVSPELLPPNQDGSVAQQTEKIVGPYELHDFFLYYMLRWGFSPKKILRMAQHSFAGTYDEETIAKWLNIFLRRFYANQFKRSCMPDGPKAGSISLSPRGDFRMPSDAVIPKPFL